MKDARVVIRIKLANDKCAQHTVEQSLTGWFILRLEVQESLAVIGGLFANPLEAEYGPLPSPLFPKETFKVVEDTPKTLLPIHHQQILATPFGI